MFKKLVRWSKSKLRMEDDRSEILEDGSGSGHPGAGAGGGRPGSAADGGCRSRRGPRALGQRCSDTQPRTQQRTCSGRRSRSEGERLHQRGGHVQAVPYAHHYPVRPPTNANGLIARYHDDPRTTALYNSTPPVFYSQQHGQPYYLVYHNLQSPYEHQPQHVQHPHQPRQPQPSQHVRHPKHSQHSRRPHHSQPPQQSQHPQRSQHPQHSRHPQHPQQPPQSLDFHNASSHTFPPLMYGENGCNGSESSRIPPNARMQTGLGTMNIPTPLAIDSRVHHTHAFPALPLSPVERWPAQQISYDTTTAAGSSSRENVIGYGGAASITGQEAEQELIDRAIAMSLMEEESTPGEVVSSEWERRQDSEQNMEDARLARELQREEEEFFARQIQSDSSDTSNLRQNRSAMKCGHCGNRINSSAIVWKDRLFHSECFTCNICKEPISERTFQQDETAKCVYHIECYARKFLPTCRICMQTIKQDHDGLVRYQEHPYFKDRYCRSHNMDGTPSCTSCTRKEQNHTPYAQLGDGRYLCLDCLGSAVLDNKDVQPLYDEVLAFFRNKHNLQQHMKPPLYLVDQETLNDSVQVEGGHEGVTCGLCISHERVVRTMVHSPQAQSYSGHGVLQVGTRAETIKTVRSCSVSAILVLYGFPWLKTGSIIAHECMHAYLRLTNTPPLAPMVEEGLCQLMSLLWLEDVVPRMTDSPEDMQKVETGSYFAYEIRMDSSPIYGDGVRAALAAYHHYGGLYHVLDHVRSTGWFPLVPPECASDFQIDS